MPDPIGAATTHFLSHLPHWSPKAIQGEEAAEELPCPRVRQQIVRANEKVKFLSYTYKRTDASFLYHLLYTYLHGMHCGPFGSRVRPKRRVK